MTLYEYIVALDIDGMAGFIHGLIDETKNQIYEQLRKQDVVFDVISVDESVSLLQNKRMLESEVIE